MSFIISVHQRKLPEAHFAAPWFGAEGIRI
jgi:hypothetical protein